MSDTRGRAFLDDIGSSSVRWVVEEDTFKGLGTSYGYLQINDDRGSVNFSRYEGDPLKFLDTLIEELQKFRDALKV